MFNRKVEIFINILLGVLFMGLCITPTTVFPHTITEWLVSDTFKSETIHLAIDREYIQDQAHILPAAGEKDPHVNFVWIKTKTGKDGIIDFQKLRLPYREHCVVYAATYIYSSIEQNAVLGVGHVKGTAMWLNEKKIYHHLSFHQLKKAENKVTIRLAKGWNRLLVKVVHSTGKFTLGVDITDEKGVALANVVTTNRKPRNMHIVHVENFAFINHIHLAPGVQTGKTRQFPLVININNLGDDLKQPGSLLIQADGIEIKRVGFVLDGSSQVKVSLKGDEIRSLLNKDLKIESFLKRKKCDEAHFKINAPIFITSLFGAPDLPIQLAVLKKLYTDLLENIKWYHVFSSNPINTDEGSLDRCVDFALNEDWNAFIKELEGEFKELKDFSATIKKDTLHMIGQSHIDIAWLWRWQETVDVSRRTFQSALGFFDKVPEFKYIQSQAAVFEWMEKDYPDLFEAIQTKVKEGRFFLVGGMWVEPDLNLISGESLVRQFLYGKRYFQQKFGVDCTTGYTPDTFGYTWSMPQILKKCGFKYFVTTKIRWNDTTTFPYSLFRWVSPDGSEVLTCFPMDINLDNNLETISTHYQTFKEEGINDLPVLYGVGDHGGGPTQQHFDNIKKMQHLATYPSVHYNDLDSYLSKIETNYPELPKWKDELYLEYHRGTLTTQALVKKQNRQSEIALEIAEKLAMYSGISYPQEKFDKAWKKTLFNQFHDILPGSSIPDVYRDATKDYKEVKGITDNIINQSLVQIANQIKLKGSGIPVVVFNPLNWKRTDLVTHHIPDGISIKKVMKQDGHSIPFQQHEDQLLFIARNVPESGYTTYWLEVGHEEEAKMRPLITGNILENVFFKIEINLANGNIHSFYDKRQKRHVLTRNQEGNVLQFFEDQPKLYDAWNIGYTGKSWEGDRVERIEVLENGPVRAVLRIVRPFGTSKFTQDYIIYSDIPRLDIRTHVDWHEHHILAKAAFPVNVEADFATFDMAYGSIQRTTKPATPAENAKFEVPAHKYVDLSDEMYGVTLLNDCKYGYDVKDNMMRITLLRSPLTPDPIEIPKGYVNPYADQGEHEFMYSIYPHSGDCKEALSVRKGYEFNYPLMPILAEKRGGNRNPEHSFIKITPENLILSVVKKAEDSGQQIIRLYEVKGQRVQGHIVFDRPVQRAWVTNMLEEKGEELDVQQNSVSLIVQPYEIVTLLIK